MGQHAVLLGAVGVLSEVSDVQRAAFNTSFKQAGLDWDWDAQAYQAMLVIPGGATRIARYAETQGQDVDVDQIYKGKVLAFEAAVAGGIPLRLGVADLIAQAQNAGHKIGFVTGTDPRQVHLMLDGLAQELDASVFDYIGNGTLVAHPKPAPDIYNHALRVLGVAAVDAVAIEDTPESAQAAVAAGIRTIGFPGKAAKGREFGPGVEVVSALGPSLIDA